MATARRLGSRRDDRGVSLFAQMWPRAVGSVRVESLSVVREVA